MFIQTFISISLFNSFHFLLADGSKTTPSSSKILSACLREGFGRESKIKPPDISEIILAKKPSYVGADKTKKWNT